MTKMPDLPGPNSGILGIPIALEFQKDPLTFLTKVVHQYDEDIIHWKFGPQYDVYLITHPDYVHELLVKQWRKIKKWERMAAVSAKIAGPNNLLIAEGDIWKQNRRMSAPAFHTQRIKKYISIMERHTTKLIADWQDGDIIDIDLKMTEVTMGIIGEILFDIKDIEGDAADLSDALKIIMDMFMLEATSLMPLPDWVPSPRNLKEDAAMDFASEYILNVIKERRESGEDQGDVLSALLQVVDEETGDTFSDKEVLEQLYILFTAGFETTASLMIWTLYLLSKHPEMQDDLYQEVSSLMQGQTPTLDDLEAMTLTDRVIKEAMRIYPPVWSLFLRESTEELTLGGHTFPPKAVFFVSPWVMHHDPRYWASPQTFDPKRFEGNWKNTVPNYSFMPFGGGPRVCIGSHLAEMEAEVILATLVKSFKFDLTSLTDEIELHPTVSVRPKNGLNLKVRKR